jgi:molybdopterin-guanine dinucleotide biosynthesis protein A
MKVSLLERLRAFVLRGERKTGLWARENRTAQAVFEDAAGFANINTLIELDQLQKGSH